MKTQTRVEPISLPLISVKKNFWLISGKLIPPLLMIPRKMDRLSKFAYSLMRPVSSQRKIGPHMKSLTESAWRNKYEQYRQN
ncbi:MAG: hypothetical protein SGI74_09625 [Oligoflexia bacterium]|nr:hypothetical protein [Oligoflexia bacterium]